MDSIYGAIIGDIAGSVFEGSKWSGSSLEEAICSDFMQFAWNPRQYIGYKISDGPILGLDGQRFTDDTVLTCAVAHWLNYNYQSCELRDLCLKQSLKLFCNTYPNAGYGKLFKEWCQKLDFSIDGDSFGNGAAMRCSPIIYCSYDDIMVMMNALSSAIPTHNSKEGIKGAQAIALASYLATIKESKNSIKTRIVDYFKYDLDFTIDRKRGKLKFHSEAEVTVPLAFAAFFESNSFEETIKRAISVGGDTDTIANMAGSIAGAYYGIPDDLRQLTRKYLDKNLLNVLDLFENKHIKKEKKDGC